MGEVDPIMKYGFIITVESYQATPSIPYVKYATEDGKLMKKAFVDYIGIPEENIIIYRDSDFTMSSCNYKLRDQIRSLPETSVVYLYYAGHGFFINGENCCTMYDTSLNHLRDTSVSFDQFFLEEFKNSKSRKLIAFIDACSRPFDEHERSVQNRYFVLDDIADDFYRKGFSYAILCACSPGQGSSSDDELKHGVWTSMLYEALSGETELGNEISANQLVKYLDAKVRDYCKFSDDHFKLQNCYAIVSGSGDVSVISPDPNDYILFLDEYFDWKYKFFDYVKYHYNQLINDDPSIYILDNFLIARDVFYELDIDDNYDWDIDISRFQLIRKEIEDEDVRINDGKQSQILEIISRLCQAIKPNCED